MKRERWIDIAKCIAILAVIIDHLYTRAYNNEMILRATYFSVGLFVLVQGFSTYLSYVNSEIQLYKKVVKRIKGIIIPYIVATVVCLIVLYKSFDFEQFINSLINFNTTGPYYYVILYIQLVIVSPILFRLVNKCDECRTPIVAKTILVVGVTIFSHYTSIYTKLNESYGGGSKLLGGSYLILLCVGMLVGNAYPKISQMSKSSMICVMLVNIVLAVSTFAYISRFGFDWIGKELFGPGVNPPGMFLMLYSIFIFGVIMLCNLTLGEVWTHSKIVKFFTYIGKHTLYIFLYHEIVLILIDPYVNGLDVGIKGLIYTVMMVIIPLLIERAVIFTVNIIRDSYSESKITGV